jgi:predicted PurR-regulated permease PerM
MADTTGAARPNDLKTFARKLAIVLAFVGLGILLWKIRHVLVVIYIAAVLAAGIAPVVRRVQVWTRIWTRRRIRRGTAVLIVYLPFLTVAIIVGALLIPRLLLETRSLFSELPALLEETVLQPLEAYIPIEEMRRMVTEQNRENGIPIFNIVINTLTAITAIVSVIFMVAYMLIDGDRLRNMILLLFPAEQRAARSATIRRLSRRMSHWLGAQLILALIVGLATFVGLVALRIPYAIPLALLATIGEMIPVIGPILGAIPVLLIAITLSPWQFWGALALAILIQQAENYLLVPRLMGSRVSISPLAVFIAFLVGASLYGIVGALLAVPSAVIIQILFEEHFLLARERRQTRGRRGTVINYEKRGS